jgi:uncharacterized protein (TIGR03435 family)
VAQAQVPSSPAFDVASIKANTSAARASTMRSQPGRWTATNVTLQALILSAYRLEGFQLSGGPGWVRSDRFDIVAKIPDGLQSPPLPSMVQALLADRFKLVVCTESRQLPVYALVAARSDKRLGPQVHPTTADCAAHADSSVTKEKGAKEKSNGGKQSPCSAVVGPGMLSAGALTMAALASSLSGVVQRTVTDRTGIEGTFQMKLTWTPDQMPRTGSDATKIKGAKIDPNGPSIFTALQEQLGLKLQSARGPVDVFIIERVERPSLN